ncbi:hypothetical protein N0V82_009682 [Gnomoniopsis sp. IMI 355080]|nr:hypothetical protein N0V82_009682 [Gnomoniopsis sp. IMI 355080]
MQAVQNGTGFPTGWPNPFLHENTDEFAVLSNLVNQDNFTVEQALEHINDLTMVALSRYPSNPEQGHGLVEYRISQCVLELAQRLEPNIHAKLVAFLVELSQRTAMNPSTGEPLEDQEGAVLWTELPSFGYSVDEEYYGPAYADPHDPDLDIVKKQRWSRLNAFLAQITQATEIDYALPTTGDTKVPWRRTDKSPRAIWTFQTAFEEETELSLLAQARSSAVWAACEWFIYASETLWDQVQHERKFGESEGTGPKYSSKGWTGFERERWHIWVEALEKIQQACASAENAAGEVDEDVKQRLQHALDSIRLAEGTSLG